MKGEIGGIGRERVERVGRQTERVERGGREGGIERERVEKEGYRRREGRERGRQRERRSLSVGGHPFFPINT